MMSVNKKIQNSVHLYTLFLN